MERPQYCVYNQTSECFLSLAVTHADGPLARFKGLLGGRTQRYDEGKWVVQPKGMHFFHVFSSRDLVFLDGKHCVIAVIESFPQFRFAPLCGQVASVLDLPPRTVDSSQTQPGNQLVICAAEELEFRLRRMPDLQKHEFANFSVVPGDAQVPTQFRAKSLTPDRRVARRKRWPRLVAYDSTGGALEVHGVKDMSANGLYLITEDRWPLGSPVMMTLQRTDGIDDNPKNNAITVQLRVIRWGKDGVGLEFVQSETEESPLLALTGAR